MKRQSWLQNLLTFTLFWQHYFQKITGRSSSWEVRAPYSLSGSRGFESHQKWESAVTFRIPYFQREYWFEPRKQSSRGINISCKNLLPNWCKTKKTLKKGFVMSSTYSVIRVIYFGSCSFPIAGERERERDSSPFGKKAVTDFRFKFCNFWFIFK